jgi:hypothetical protein
MLSQTQDPNVFHLGSKFFPIQDLHQYFNLKNWFLSSRKYGSGCSSRILVLFFTYPGSRGPKGTGNDEIVALHEMVVNK